MTVEAVGYASTIESEHHVDSAGAARYALMASKSTTAVNAEAVVYVSITTYDTRVGSVSQ